MKLQLFHLPAVVALLALVALPAGANDGGGLGIGLKAGVNFSDLTGDDVVEGEDLIQVGEESRTGLVLGAFLTFNLSEMFALQPEVLYTQKGQDIEVEQAGELFNQETQLNYLEIPLLAKLSFADAEAGVRPNVFAGPAMSILMDTETEVETPVGGGTIITPEEDDFNDVDWGLVFGAGLDFNLSGLVLGIEGRWTAGLTSIDNTEEDLTFRNSVFSALASVAFQPFGR